MLKTITMFIGVICILYLGRHSSSWLDKPIGLDGIAKIVSIGRLIVAQFSIVTRTASLMFYPSPIHRLRSDYLHLHIDAFSILDG